MKRQIDIKDISDGKLYKGKDMVKADCLGCKGCSDCCKGMGNTIILDPYDVFRLTKGLGQPLAMLLGKHVELNVVDGVILPNLMMNGKNEACGYLDENGRCSVHSIRPGICRLFPLGRIYEEDGFSYFLQIHECTKPHAKVKVEKWLDTPQFSRYETYIAEWHNFLMWVEEILDNKSEEQQKLINMQVLQSMFLLPYETDEFYDEYEARKMACIKELAKIV